MSRGLEIVRRATGALSRGEVDAFLESWSPDGVLDWSRSRGLEAQVYRGRAEIRDFAERFLEAFDEIRFEFGDSIEVENELLIVDNMAYMRGRDAVEVQARSAWLVNVKGGKQTWLTLYQTKQDALEAVGLSE
jgi:ketosteroid isomerase-like protein